MFSSSLTTSSLSTEPRQTKVLLKPFSRRKRRTVVVTIDAAKGRNAGMKGRNPSSLQPVQKRVEDDDERQEQGQRNRKREKRLPNVKYSERTGKPISYSGGQVSKQSLKRIKEATKTTEREKNEENERKALERKKFQSAQKKAVPQIVTDRMLSRVVRFSGIPMVLGFTTGPTYYYFAKINAQEWLEPWIFFAASTATFGLAFLGITYGVLSASWDPSREGSALGVDEFKMNIPILFQTILGKSDREYTASEFDVDGEGDYD
ncbi:unnamed protein product [Bathycoccus prasinos]|jgi:hypothetical protein|tara:strand:- start:1900 stop:2685 length:786 start_codon:yes stop_codon:yes gene_type:complete